MNFITRILRDTATNATDLVTEEVGEDKVRVIAIGKQDASRLLCRLLKDPDCGPRAEQAYQSFLSELRAS